MCIRDRVFAVEYVGAVFVFFDGPVLSRSGFFDDAVFEAACLDAFAFVGLAEMCIRDRYKRLIFEFYFRRVGGSRRK